MPTPQQKLAAALERLRELQEQPVTAIQSKDLSRAEREILLRNGFLQKVMKGWYIASRPDDRPGDTTPWYSSFWEFCADYSNNRLGDQWCLSPEQSLSLHVGNRTVPQQLIIRSPIGGNKPIGLLHETSIFDLRGSLPPPHEMVRLDKLNLYEMTAALINATASFYTRNPTDARAALLSIQAPSQLMAKLLEGGHSTIAGRLCGAFRNIGKSEFADTIKSTMKSVGYEVLETDPFESEFSVPTTLPVESPHAARLRLIWQTLREPVISRFPPGPSATPTSDQYLQRVDDAYVKDAYHSLSIEGYQVSPLLIDSVKSGKWNPEESDADRQQRNALAARGYFQAFELVKKSLQRVLGGAPASEVAREEHGLWYRELFLPLVNVGLVAPSSLAGYRSGRVFIKGSRHVPPAGAAVPDLMTTFFDLLATEEHPGVRVVLGHFIFVYIHPYPDGNGRTARFLMNLLLAAGGYPWTVIPVEHRTEYMESLEAASVEQDIVPFTKFLAGLVQRNIDGEQVGALPI